MASDDDSSDDGRDAGCSKRPPAKGSAHDALFADPTLTRLIKAILRAKGIPPQDIDDLTQDVLIALVVWSRKETTGATGEDLAAGARTITRTVATGYWRRVAVAGKHTVGAIEDSDEHAPRPNGSTVDPLDLKRVLVEINALIASGAISEKGAALLVAVCEETTLAEHANETGQEAAAVRKMRERTQEKVVAHLQKRKMTDVGLLGLFTRGAAVAAAVAVAIILGLLAYQGRLGGVLDIPVAWGPKPPPVREPVEPPAPPPPSIEEVAKVLTPPTDDRDKAARELLRAEKDYKNYAWDDCVRHVGEATKLDPNAGAAPELTNGCLEEKDRDMNAKAGWQRPPRK